MVRYTVYQAADHEEMAGLLAEVFTSHDPPAIAVGLTGGEFRFFVQLFAEKAAAEELTVVARSVKTGQMVGALLAEDAAGAAPTGMEHVSAKFHPIFDILEQLTVEHRAGRPLRTGESLHLFLLGVASQYASQGIAQSLIRKVLENGASRGYRRAVAEATNLTSQHIFHKLGFVDCVRRSYRDHRFNSQPHFASIAAHGGPVLMEKALGLPA
jgi:ribosomal protein S18 acetylase RimI-like enzyme